LEITGNSGSEFLAEFRTQWNCGAEAARAPQIVRIGFKKPAALPSTSLPTHRGTFQFQKNVAIAAPASGGAWRLFECGTSSSPLVYAC
jgi:hypothetical protein